MQAPDFRSFRRQPVIITAAELEESLRRQTITRIMEQLEQRMVFFSGGYTAEEETSIPKWARDGGNCLNFAQNLNSELRRELPDMSARIVRSNDSGHFASLAQVSAEVRLLLDPTYFARGGMEVPSIPGEENEVRAYPVLRGEHSKISARRNDNSEITISWERVQERDHPSTYSVNLTQSDTKFENAAPELLHFIAERRSFFLRKLLHDGTYIILLASLDLKNESDLLIKQTGEKWIVQDDKKFIPVLERLARAINGQPSPQEVMDFFLTRLKKHQELLL